MENITVLISSFLGRGQRWRLVALVALFFVAGCTVELYPPAQEVNNLPDGGKVDVLPDTIPRAFSFGPRIYWSQIIASDSAYSIAVTDANNKGRWLDSLRWVPSGPFVTVNGDTLSTRAYARDNSGVTGDNQVLTYNGSGSLTIESGNTVDMSDLLDNTDDQTIDTFSLSANILSLSIESDGEAAKTVDLSGYLDNTDAQTIDTLTLQGDTMLQVSLSGDGAPVKELDLSALRSVVDSTRLTQDSILVYYQDGAEVGRDTIAGTGGSETITLSGDVTGSGTTAITTTIATGAVGADELASTAVTPGSYTSADITIDADGRITSAASGGGADNLGDHTMTQNLVTNGNWISGDGGNEGISVNSSGQVGIGTNSTSDLLKIQQPVSNVSTTENGLHISTNAYVNGQHLRLTNLSGSYWMKIGGLNGAYLAFDSNLAFQFRSNGTQVFYMGIATLDGGATYSSLSIPGESPWRVPLLVQGHKTGQLEDLFVVQDGGAAKTKYFRVAPGGKIGLSVDPEYTLDVGGTDAVRLPVGTTAQRPTGANGLLRLSSTNNKLEAYYNAQWNTIASEEIEDDGSASDTTDGSGDITVSHTLGSASITVTATATGTTFYHVQVHTKTSTTFKIRFFDAAGAAVTATAVTADWIAKLQ